MDKRTKSLRWTDEECAFVAHLCQLNYLSKSTFHKLSLWYYINMAEDAGIITPYDPIFDDPQSQEAQAALTPRPYCYPDADDVGLAAAEEGQEFNKESNNSSKK